MVNYTEDNKQYFGTKHDVVYHIHTAKSISTIWKKITL